MRARQIFAAGFILIGGMAMALTEKDAALCDVAAILKVATTECHPETNKNTWLEIGRAHV